MKPYVLMIIVVVVIIIIILNMLKNVKIVAFSFVHFKQQKKESIKITSRYFPPDETCFPEQQQKWDLWSYRLYYIDRYHHFVLLYILDGHFTRLQYCTQYEV